MKLLVLAAILLLAGQSARAETSQVIWEQRFDVAALTRTDWALDGSALLANGVLHTTGLSEIKLSGARRLPEERLPADGEGQFLRLEWAVVPVSSGAAGQIVSVHEGPAIVAFAEGTAVLNLAYRARVPITLGVEVTVSCDFTRDRVLSWKLDGQEQLDAPVPALKAGAATAKIVLGDLDWGKGESEWRWIRLTRVSQEDPMAALRSKWEAPRTVENGRPALFLLGQASPMMKVFREANDFSGSFAPHVRIAAAGRERESLQLVVVPIAHALRGATVEVSDLLQDDGHTVLPASHVTWNPVGYVQTVPSDSAITRVGWWWPDILLPSTPFDVEAGFVQPIWFTVDVPAEAKAGVYRGLVTVRAEGVEQSVGLEVTVRPFSLPLRGKLKTAFSMNPGAWEIWYAPDEVRQRLGLENEEGGLHGFLYRDYPEALPHEKWLAFYDFLLAHRLSPATIYSDLHGGRSRVVPRKDDMEYCYERGLNAACLAYVNTLPEDPAAADQYVRDLTAWLSDWDAFRRETNWPDFTWYVHGFDESDMQADHETRIDPSIGRLYGLIGADFPWVKRESANPLNPAHIGLFDIWTPVTAQWTPEYRPRQEAGDEVWAYVCCWPHRPYANLFLDFPGVDPRILPWQYYQHGLTGFLYYLVNHFDLQENFGTAEPKWPERAWNPLSFNTNSDGILIYPGPDATPLASTRLENLRDGIEDYEALAMLADLTARLQQAGGNDALLARAREVLAVRPEVTNSWTEYTQDPQAIVAARAEVDGLIESAMRALNDL